jgi:hypothetical protein
LLTNLHLCQDAAFTKITDGGGIAAPQWRSLTTTGNQLLLPDVWGRTQSNQLTTNTPDKPTTGQRQVPALWELPARMGQAFSSGNALAIHLDKGFCK